MVLSMIKVSNFRSLSENEDTTEFSTDFLYDLLNASKQAAMDHDKVFIFVSFV